VTAATYLSPSIYWSVNFGMIALMGLLVLVYITLFTKMKYHKWKFTHEFMGGVFIFAVLHSFLVRGSVSEGIIFHGYYTYIIIVSIIGLAAFTYSLFIKNRSMKNAVYKIKEIKHIGKVFEIDMTPEHKPISYQSGQFIFVRFYNEKLSDESHPFSIASKSNELELKIVVKKLGDFTQNLIHLKPGDKVSVEGPYGRFNFKNFSNKNQVWLGSGIGVVPFLGMAEEIEEQGTKVDFYYSEKENKDFIGYKELERISGEGKNFKFFPWTSGSKGWLKTHNIKEGSGTLKDKEFLVCGSPEFKESIIKGLMDEGVKKSQIHEEVFDFR
jgi:predicted ferric reductase